MNIINNAAEILTKTKLLVILVTASLLVSCDTVNGVLWYLKLKPNHTYDEAIVPPSPNYFSNENWAALPEKADNTDITPTPEINANKANSNIDIFYIHPTTFHSASHWNQPLTDSATNQLTDEWVLPNQASIFNTCCNIYVPRYRQATLYSFMTDVPSADKAIDLAFSDIRAAFHHFLKHYNKGRPFIIASHSQGAWHGLRLLESDIVNRELKQKLVAAYLVGIPLPIDKLERGLNGIPLCTSASQSNCILSWNAILNTAYKEVFFDYSRISYKGVYETNKGKTLVCINPLTWSNDSSFAESKLNLGGVDYKKNIESRPSLDVGIVGAKCVDGLLHITQPKTNYNYTWMLFGEGIYHMHDYDLFHMNIRKNVELRIKNFLEQDGAS